MPARWSGRRWKLQFCQVTWWPSSWKPWPAGRVIVIGGSGAQSGPSDASS
jgi:hypothetical protein